MNAFRAAMRNGDVARQVDPRAAKDGGRRASDRTGLTGVIVPRVERRTTDQRREERYRGIVDRATLTFRRKTVLVKVVNISEGGLMVETTILPHIGECIEVEFDGFDPLPATVRWVRDGRIGLDVGEGGISLD